MPELPEPEPISMPELPQENGASSAFPSSPSSSGNGEPKQSGGGSNEILSVPKEVDPIQDAFRAPSDTKVKLRVPMSDGSVVDLLVDRDELINQLGNFTSARKTFQFDRTPIIDVFTNLAVLMNKSFEPPPGLAGDGISPTPAAQLVSGVYKNMNPLEVFYRVANSHGFRVREESGVLRVFREENVNVADLVAVVYTTRYVNLFNYIDSIRAFMSPKGRLAVNAFNHQGKLEIDHEKGTAKTNIETKNLFGPINSGEPDAVKLGSSSSSSSSGGGGSSITSTTVKSDKDTTDAVLPNNAFSITILDLPEVHDAIRDFLASIDKPKRQIAIQVRLYRFSDSPTFRYGIDWQNLLEGYVLNGTFGDKRGGTTTSEAGEDENGAPLLRKLANNVKFDIFAPGSFILNPSAVSVLLNFFRESGYGMQIAAPNAVAQHGQTTFLRSVTRTPIVAGSTTTGQDGNSTQTNNVQFLDIGTTLNVTPFIMDDTSVDPNQWELYLDLRPEITREGERIDFGGNIGEIPEVIAIAPTTSVRLKNGDTVFLGGLSNTDYTKIDSGIPFLKDIPFLGALFGDKGNNQTSEEVVFLVTAKIIDFNQKVSPLISNWRLAESIRQDSQTPTFNMLPVNEPYHLSNIKSPEEERASEKQKQYEVEFRQKRYAAKYPQELKTHAPYTPDSSRSVIGTKPSVVKPRASTSYRNAEPGFVKSSKGPRALIGGGTSTAAFVPQPSGHAHAVGDPVLPSPPPYQASPTSMRSYMRSPYAPHSGLVDVSGFQSGDRALCPFTGKVFIVP